MSISNETLLDLTTRINNDSKSWDGKPGTQLLGLLHADLAGVARREKRETSDAVFEAWQLLALDATVLLADSILGLLRRKVRLRLIDSAIAERLLCSPATGGKQRARQRDVSSPVGLEERTDAAETTTSGERPAGTDHQSEALKLAASLIRRASQLDPEAAREIVDSICDIAADGRVTTTIAARARAVAASNLGEQLGVRREIWSAAVSLILGSQTGAGSLLQAELDGELVGDWSENDRRVVTARKRMGLMSA